MCDLGAVKLCLYTSLWPNSPDPQFLIAKRIGLPLAVEPKCVIWGPCQGFWFHKVVWCLSNSRIRVSRAMSTLQIQTQKTQSVKWTHSPANITKTLYGPMCWNKWPKNNNSNTQPVAAGSKLPDKYAASRSHLRLQAWWEIHMNSPFLLQVLRNIDWGPCSELEKCHKLAIGVFCAQHASEECFSCLLLWNHYFDKATYQLMDNGGYCLPS